LEIPTNSRWIERRTDRHRILERAGGRTPVVGRSCGGVLFGAR
jgi:hypothetical protein